jgi:hypothetical protein
VELWVIDRITFHWQAAGSSEKTIPVYIVCQVGFEIALRIHSPRRPGSCLPRHVQCSGHEGAMTCSSSPTAAITPIHTGFSVGSCN